MLDPGVLLRELFQKLPAVELNLAGRIIGVCGGSIANGLAVGLVDRLFDDEFPRIEDPLDNGELRQRGEPGQAGYQVFRVLWIDQNTGRVALLIDRTDVVLARNECLRLSRLAAVGRLISGIVHEINNPLSGIIGYSQLLMLKDLDVEAHRQVEKIHGEAQRTSRIVRNLLDFSRRRPSRAGRVRLGGVLDKALDLKAHDLRVRNISIHRDVSDSLPHIQGDPHQLLQVFVNLITNAEQAMHAVDRGGRLSFLATTRGDRIELRVQDTGPGIAEHLREQIFEAFFTTKPEGVGTGLGLGLCRDVLSKFDSTIELGRSVEPGGGGAVFVLTFPVATEVDRQDRDPGQELNVRVRGRKLLVVEDDPVCRALIVDSFEPLGNQVYAFDRSEPALRFLERHVVDVIITDLHRPGPDGLEFLQRVRQFDEPLASRVLFLTGDTINEELCEAIRRTGNPLLAKPATIHDLRAAVARIVSRPANRQRTLFAMDAD